MEIEMLGGCVCAFLRFSRFSKGKPSVFGPRLTAAESAPSAGEVSLPGLLAE